jgi:hypothetical protein
MLLMMEIKTVIGVVIMHHAQYALHLQTVDTIGVFGGNANGVGDR